MTSESDSRALREAAKKGDIGIYGLSFSLNLSRKLGSVDLDTNQTLGELLADVAQETIDESPHVDTIEAYVNGDSVTEQFSAVSRRGLDLLIERNRTEPLPTSAPEL